MEQYTDTAQKLARVGCVSIGVVYILVGIMAILSLLRLGEANADEQRIINFLLDLPLGEVLIGGIAGGLIAYIIWRFFEAYTDPYNFGDDKKGLFKRTGIALSGLGYGVIVFSAIRILTGNGGNGEEEQQLVVQQVLQWPAGRWLIGATGAITALTGLVQFTYVYGGDYHKRLHLSQLSSFQARSIHALAWAGYVARGIILLILGYFFLRAAVNLEPEAVGDTDTAFDFIGGGTLGDAVFFMVALGTISYGLFMFVCSYLYKFEREEHGSGKDDEWTDPG
jgi:hypothetical protein